MNGMPTFSRVISRSLSPAKSRADDGHQPISTQPGQAEPTDAPAAKRARVVGADGPTLAAPQRPAPPTRPSVTELWNTLPRDIWEKIFEDVHKVSTPDVKQGYRDALYDQQRAV